MEDKKCIVVVSSYYGPYAGNFIASLERFDIEMKKRKYRIIYIFHEKAKEFEWLSEFKISKDAVYLLPYNPYSLDNIRRFKEIFLREKVDIIYSRLGGWEITAHLAALHIPCVWHFEFGLQINSIKQKIKYGFKYKILGRNNVYHIAISKQGAEAINSFKVRNTCVFIPNAPELARFSTLQERENPQKTLISILIFAYDPYTKGLDIALSALEKLNFLNERYKLLIVAQDATMQFLNKRYREIPNWVTILEPSEDVSSIYKQAQILLSASRSEGFSYCLMEALYCGLCAVYSDIPGTSWADEFQLAYKFSSEDVDALSEAIQRASVSDCNKRKQEYNRKLVKDNYSMDAWASKVGNFIDGIFYHEGKKDE